MTQNNRSNRVQQSPQPDVIDLGKLLGILLDGKWIILFSTAIFACLGIAYALQSTPIFKADALVQVEKKSSGFPALSSDVGEMFEQDSSIAAEIEIIKSRSLLEKTVDKFDLTTVAVPIYSPVVGKLYARTLGQEGKIKVERFALEPGIQANGYTIVITNADKGTYQLLDRENKLLLEGVVGELAQNNGVRLFVSELSGSQDQAFALFKRSKLSAIQWLSGSLTISEKGRQSGVLLFEFQGVNPQQISLLLDDIANNYFLQNIDRNAAQAENSLQFLQDKLPEVKAELTGYEERLNNYRQENDSVDLGMEAQSTLQAMVSLESQLNELSFKESEILQKFTTNHPTYISLQNKKRALQNQKQRLEEQIKKLPKTQREILRLTRDVEVNNQIYLQLLNKNQELNLVKASTVGNVRILDKAITYGGPVKPKKALIVLIATVFGGIISVGFVLLRAALHRGVESPDQIEELGIPVYATIPKSPQQEKTERQLAKNRSNKKQIRMEEILLSCINPADISVEALRSLRTSLHFAMMEAKNNIIMMTGPSPAIGKSFVASNFASIIASAGQKVLLIDADMRKGHIGKGTALAHTDGLSDYLVSDKAITEVVHIGELENLDFISKGKTPPNPSELLMHQRFEELCAWASENYDIVIIDTPPVLAVTDAAIIGRQAGTTLMITRFAKTAPREIEVAADRLEQAGIEVKGVILNAVEKTASSYYTYGYYNYAYKSE